MWPASRQVRWALLDDWQKVRDIQTNFAVRVTLLGVQRKMQER
jgi:hypothetical protein